jgi:hypothetical protein
MSIEIECALIRELTFEMSGPRRLAQPAGERPLDGRVGRHVAEREGLCERSALFDKQRPQYRTMAVRLVLAVATN